MFHRLADLASWCDRHGVSSLMRASFDSFGNTEVQIMPDDFEALGIGGLVTTRAYGSGSATHYEGALGGVRVTACRISDTRVDSGPTIGNV